MLIHQNSFSKFLNAGFIFVLLLLLNSEFSFAQTETKSDTLQIIEPSAIPIIKVVEDMAELNEDLKLMEGRVVIGEDFKSIDSLFPLFRKNIKEQKEYALNFIKANPNQLKINNLYQQWSDNESYLDGWLSTINSYEERNAKISETISFTEKTWELTYENAKTELVPEDLLLSIETSLNRIKSVKKRLDLSNYEYLKLESNINSEIEEINEIKERLIALKESETYDLFYLRHKPLWQTSFAETENSEINKGDSFSKSLEGAIDFYNKNKDKLPLYILFIGLIVALVLYVKSIYMKYDVQIQNVKLQVGKKLILNQTFYCILFLVLITTNFSLIAAPALLVNVLGVLMLITSILIIKPYMPSKYRSLLFFPIILFLLDASKAYIWFHSAYYRLFLLGEILFIAGVLFYFIGLPRNVQKENINTLGNILLRLVPLFYIICIISIVSNILGYTNLTDLTIRLCVYSGLITMLFYSIFLISEGLLMGLIYRQYFIRSSIDEAKKQAIEKKLIQGIRIVVFIIWLGFFLRVIDQLQSIIAFFTSVLNEPYRFGNLTLTIGAILTFILILVISYLITKAIAFVMNEEKGFIESFKLPKGVPAVISLVLRYFIFALGIALALSSLGIDLSKFNLMAGALGLGIGFGLQSVISNFVSGLILVFERPILSGDTVEVNNLLGTVNRIGIRSSNIRTFDGAEVVVPNNNLISNDLINWTLSDSVRRIEILVGTSYDADPNIVLKILRDIALDYPDTLKNPPPLALFKDFGDSSLNFQLYFWVYYENSLKAKSDVSVEIYNQFKKANIEIPFPQQDVTIKNMDSIVKPDDPK